MRNEYGTPLEFKAGENGTVEGYGSVFGNADDCGDVVDAGAFSDSLAKGGPVRMLRDHDPTKVIGVWDQASEDDRGLYLKGRFATNTALGKETYELVKMGALTGLSIGYRVKDYELRDGNRHIKAVDLWEVSAVAFPMNALATVTGVKGDMTPRDFERFLRDEGFSHSEAKRIASASKDVLGLRDGDTGVNSLADQMRLALMRASLR